MSERSSCFLVLACFAAIFLAFFFPVFFQGRQFGFRDAAHYYYPLYQRVQQDWDADRIPLWEPEENSGMPLLGNPTAAVLYPLKIIYGLLPYAWGARVYVVAHTALAFAAMLVLMRSWGTSWTGSGLGAMSYAFGVPVLFQGANIIYLVGAAWLPLGVHAVDQWVRRGRRWAIIELAIVLAMQVLGGEPQSGYLLGLAGLGYAAGLAWQRAAARRSGTSAGPLQEPRRRPAWIRMASLLGLGILWIAGTIAIGCWVPYFREHKQPAQPLPWMSLVPAAVNAAWAIAGVVFLVVWRRRGWRSPLGQAWLGLAAAAGLAVVVSAAQLFPVLEFTRQTSRNAEGGPHDIYPFSLEPARLVGLIWPNVLGDSFGGDSSWGELLRPPGMVPHLWVPSLYLGALTLALALAALSFRGSPWRVWLSVIVFVGILGSLGAYTSPIWAARALAEGRRPFIGRLPDHSPGPREITINLAKVWAPMRPLIRRLGPLEPENTTPIREDDFLRDGDGGVYWWMSTFLPGFRQFRYPAKLFTLTSLGLAALAGIGWDALGRGGARRATIVGASLVAISVILLAGVLARRSSIIDQFRASNLGTIYGPSDPIGAYEALLRGLVQGATVLSMGLVAFRLAARRRRAAGLLVLLIATLDLGLANRRFVLTVPQSAFEGKPEVLRIIEEAERAEPTPGPYRIHRMPVWEPPIWRRKGSADRGEEIVRWERGTLQPKYGLPLGVEYAHTLGVAELYDYEWYYGGFPRRVRDPAMARLLNIGVGDKVVYFPRRSFDMWNVRYFVVPMWPNGWNDTFRGYASLLLETENVYPPTRDMNGPGGAEWMKDWTETQDFRILRNRRDHPRAWIVHEARIIEPTRGLAAGEERQKAMKEITYDDDPLWTDRERQAFDWRRYAWIDRDHLPALKEFLSGRSRDSSESVKVSLPSPQRTELDVTLKSPGIVVLADISYPGWELTIDGIPAPIYTVNRAMRGAAVKSGSSHLVYTYAPRSYRVGLIVSGLGVAVLLAFGVVCFQSPVERAIGDDSLARSGEDGHE